jgi:single-stranded-DNA-specific exonuclease
MAKVKIRRELEKSEREKLDNYSDIVAHLLFHRDIKTNKEADTFLNPDWDRDLNDPFLFKDMDKAVEFLLSAIKENKKICIYSDYDADGIPGAVIFSDFLDKIGFENYFVYIPHRNKEGFGLNKKALDKIKEDGAEIVITIDCGIADVDEVDYANELGMKVLITDHHEPNGKSPNAVAIVNHKQEGCNYPDKNLCGSGVIFKVVQALILKEDFGLNEGWEKWLIDLVGLATLSDMVPLKGENRVFAVYGLQVLRKTQRKGLQKIYAKKRLDVPNLDESDLGFMVVPNINAASRMGDAMIAYDLLRTKDEIEANSIVEHLNKINNERKGKVAAMVKEIHKKLKGLKDIKVVGMGDPDWQPSMLGLAANKIAQERKVPVLLWGRGDGDELKGSCRTGDGGNLIEIMNQLSEAGILNTFGGHKQAGGFVIRQDKVSLLQPELEKIVQESRIQNLESEAFADQGLSIDDIDIQMIKEINKLAPFGVGNPKPLFLFENIRVHNVRTFGNGGAHIDIQFQKANGQIVSAIDFYKKPEDFGLVEGEPATISLLANLEINTYGGRNEPGLRIVRVY